MRCSDLWCCVVSHQVKPFGHHTGNIWTPTVKFSAVSLEKKPQRQMKNTSRAMKVSANRHLEEKPAPC
jgi:hypothetical protein